MTRVIHDQWLSTDHRHYIISAWVINNADSVTTLLKTQHKHVRIEFFRLHTSLHLFKYHTMKMIKCNSTLFQPWYWCKFEESSLKCFKFLCILLMDHSFDLSCTVCIFFWTHQDKTLGLFNFLSVAFFYFVACWWLYNFCHSFNQSFIHTFSKGKLQPGHNFIHVNVIKFIAMAFNDLFENNCSQKRYCNLTFQFSASI